MTRTDDADTIARLAVDWVFEWDRPRDAGHWDLERALHRYYDWTVETRQYDDVDPEHRVATSAREYRDIWEPIFNRLAFADHRIESEPLVDVDVDLATSWQVFLAHLELADGTTIYNRCTNFLAWRRFPDGWKIVRDHTSSVRMAETEAARPFAELPGRQAA